MSRLRLLGFVAVLLVFMLRGNESVAQQGSSPGGPPGAPPGAPLGFSLPPEDCFDVYFGNVVFCKGLFCGTRGFLWISWLSCDEDELEACLDGAKALLEECLAEKSA